MKVYAICDRELLDSKSVSLEEFVFLAKKHQATFLQYRDKSGDFQQIAEALKILSSIWEAKLILNDYLEFPELVDGYHIGQEDLKKYGSIENIRQIIGDKILGLSTHNFDEVLEANNFNLDYIGLGAYRNTSTKKDVKHILGNKVEELAKFSKHPVAVIGGVKLTDKFQNIEYLAIGSGLLNS